MANLAAGDSTTVDFDWNVAGLELRTYTIEAEAILAGDDEPTDNKRTSDWTIEIIPEFPTSTLLPILIIAILAKRAIKQRHL